VLFFVLQRRGGGAQAVLAFRVQALFDALRNAHARLQISFFLGPTAELLLSLYGSNAPVEFHSGTQKHRRRLPYSRIGFAFLSRRMRWLGRAGGVAAVVIVRGNHQHMQRSEYNAGLPAEVPVQHGWVPRYRWCF